MRGKKGIASEKLAVPRPEATRKSAFNLRFFAVVPRKSQDFQEEDCRAPAGLAMTGCFRLAQRDHREFPGVCRETGT